MSYGTKYILKATNLLNEYYEIKFDFLNWAGVVTEVKADKEFLKLRSTQGDEDRLTPILGTEAIIRIFVAEEDSITISDLIATHDSDIKVTATRIELSSGVEFIHFQGFVVVEDNNQPFLDKPYTLQIRALDGLGLLKGLDLVDTDGVLFTGSQTINQWIGQILYKTNQDVPVRVYFNFFPNNFSEITALTEITLNAITFAQGFPATSTDPSIDPNASAADDCYTALEKIIRNLRCRLFFEDGRFMIVNLKEFTNPTYQFAEYTFGTPSAGLVPMNPSAVGQKTYNLSVGKQEMMFPVQQDAILYLKLAYKYVKLAFNYDQSLNKICNQDLSQGDRNATYDETISSSIIDPTIVPVVNLSTLGYDLYCFDHFNGPGGGFSGFAPVYPTSAADQRAFIREVKDALGYTIERFAVLHTTAIDNKVTYFRSNTLLIDLNDVFQIRFEWRNRVTAAASEMRVFVHLTGDDGTFWVLSGTVASATYAWIAVDSNFNDGASGALNIIDNASGSGSDIVWNSVDINSNVNTFVKTPVSGKIDILFSNMYNVDDPIEIWFRNITITIVPFLMGSYQQLKGDYNFASSNENIKQKFNETVEISDSPKRYFKGALLEPDGETLIPADWHRRGVTEHFRFAQAMQKILYAMLSRMVYKIEGTFKGVTYLDNDDLSLARPAGFLTSYFFVDGDFPTKRFIQTSFDIDIYSGQGRRVFVEIQNDANDNGWDNPSTDSPDNYKFDYIFE